MTNDELKAKRKEVLPHLASMLRESQKPEDDVFYLHPNEDHVVLSHALFWLMSKPLAGKLSHHECFLLLRKYEEEMLEEDMTDRFKVEADVPFTNEYKKTIINTLSFSC